MGILTLPSAAFGERCGNRTDGALCRRLPPGAPLDNLEYNPADAVAIARILEEDERHNLTAYVPQNSLEIPSECMCIYPGTIAFPAHLF